MVGMIKKGLAVIVLVSLLFLSGCSNEPNTLSTWGVFHSGTDSHEINLQEGDEVNFRYASFALKGDIMMTLVNPDGEVVLDMESPEDGESNYKASTEGVYKISIKKSGIFVRYKIKWHI